MQVNASATNSIKDLVRPFICNHDLYPTRHSQKVICSSGSSIFLEDGVLHKIYTIGNRIIVKLFKKNYILEDITPKRIEMSPKEEMESLRRATIYKQAERLYKVITQVNLYKLPIVFTDVSYLSLVDIMFYHGKFGQDIEVKPIEVEDNSYVAFQICTQINSFIVYLVEPSYFTDLGQFTYIPTEKSGLFNLYHKVEKEKQNYCICLPFYTILK